tara:strand:+ start:207 stop:716 length:510 start_codon:yes stop_codon:yes gene_type:complete
MNVVKSNIDNEYYRVRDAEDKVAAADTLAQINHKIKNLFTHLQKEFPNDKKVKRLVAKYKPRKLYENMEKSDYSAFSVNKGEEVHVCVRKNNTGKIITNLNNIMYVMLHELAHIMTVEIGHIDAFWDNYEFLIENAIKCGEYSFEDYDKKYTEYCGIQLLGVEEAHKLV